MQKLKGKLSISHPTYSSGEQWIHIQLIDERSGCQAFEIRMGLAKFAACLTGRSDLDCEYEWSPDTPIGKVCEIKEEIVLKPTGYGRDKASLKEAARILKPYEVDGWTGRVDDLFNHHRGVGKMARVLFTRYVDAEPESESK